MDTHELCLEADRILWESYHNGTRELHRGLRFPQMRGGKKADSTFPVRCSEQESRFAFVEAAMKEGLRYSVEVPTEKTYNFSGKTMLQRAAMTDLVIYKGNSARVNIEFKSKGKSTKANHPDIDKDLKKLLMEKYEGLWFHLLKNVNRQTIPELLAVFAASRKNSNKKISATNLISFHICVLEKKFSIHKRFEKNMLSVEMIEKEMKTVFDGTGKLIEKPKSEVNGWTYYSWPEMKV